MKKKDDKTEAGPTFYQTPNGKFLPSVYASALGRYYPYGGTFDMPRQQMYMPLDHVTAKGGYLAPILPMHFDKGTQIYRDTTEIPNYRQGGKLMDFPAPSLSEREANINYNVYASMPGRYYNNGGMIKRADGSYSQRGLWDNIRANKGSGKEPTKEMLAQERKIRANEHAFGGNMVRTSHLFGMGGHKAVFFPTNVSEPGAADKDLTYPKDAYVYANGGHLYPNGGTICPEGYFYDEETKSCQPILQDQQIVSRFRSNSGDPEFTLKELKEKNPAFYNKLIQSKYYKENPELLDIKYGEGNHPFKYSTIMNKIYWKGITKLANDLNNVKNYVNPKDDSDYVTFTNYPELGYSVKIDKGNPERFDEKTKTLYVPSENNFYYKKVAEYNLIKNARKEQEDDLIKKGYKLDITPLHSHPHQFNNVYDFDKNQYVTDSSGKFIIDNERQKFHDLGEESEGQDVNFTDPYWLPAELKGKSYEEFYKKRRAENKQLVAKQCEDCAYTQNAGYSYDNDYAYRGPAKFPKKFSIKDWENIIKIDPKKGENLYNIKEMRSAVQGVPPFPPEVMQVPTEKILPRNLVTPEASRKTQWKQNPITGTWYEDESYDSINNNTPWTDERPLGMESYNLNTGTYWTDEDAKKWQQQELKKQAEEAQKKSGQFNTITVPEGFANGGHLYDGGGPVYTYAGRPNAKYRKENDKWLISIDGGNKFKPIYDPKGERTALLNAQAKPIITTNYDPLLDNKIFPSETTQGVAQNYIMGKNLNQVAERKKVRDDYNQKAFEQSRVETVKAAPKYTTGDKVQNIVRNPLVALSYFMKPGEFAMPMNYSEFERSPNYSDETWGNNLVGQAVNAASYFHPLGLAAHAIDNVTYTSDDVQKAIQSGEFADWKRAGMSGANAALDLFAGSKFIGNSGRLLNTGEKFTLDAMNASNKLGLPSKVNNFLGTAVYPKVNSSAIKSADDLAIGKVLPQINPNSIRFNPTAKNFYNSAVLTGNAQNASEAINPLFNSNTVAKNALSLKMNTPFLNEVIGGIKNKNREVELRAAEDWTNNWVQHPATQEKILNSYKKVLEGKRLNKTEKHNLDEMIKFSSGYNATNRLGEFPLLQQQIGKNNIHNDNYGVSYTNYELPGQILDPIENSYINPKVEIKPLGLTAKNALVQSNPRYGNWISRTLNPEERMSTGVHELGHDWLKDYTIKNTDQKEILENAIDHKTVDAILAEYKQTASPEEYEKIEKHIKNDIIDNSEIHARLMEARRYFNLSPDEIITPNRSDEFLSVIRSGQTPIHAFWGNAIKEGQAGADLFNKAWLAVPAVGIGAATLPNKFKQENGLANGGYLSTAKTVFRTSELF